MFKYKTNIIDIPNVTLEKEAEVGQIFAINRGVVVEIKLIKDGTLYVDFPKNLNRMY